MPISSWIHAVAGAQQRSALYALRVAPLSWVSATPLHYWASAGKYRHCLAPTPFISCRFFVGVGSGVGLCVGPVYLAEIAPSKISGNVGELELVRLSFDLINMNLAGVLTQLGIVLGIMITQAMGLRLASPTEWRIVLFFSFVLAAAQVFLSVFVVESPAWLGGNGRSDEKKAVAKRLWGSHCNCSTTISTILCSFNVF